MRHDTLQHNAATLSSPAAGCTRVSSWVCTPAEPAVARQLGAGQATPTNPIRCRNLPQPPRSTSTHLPARSVALKSPSIRGSSSAYAGCPSGLPAPAPPPAPAVKPCPADPAPADPTPADLVPRPVTADPEPCGSDQGSSTSRNWVSGGSCSVLVRHSGVIHHSLQRAQASMRLARSCMAWQQGLHGYDVSVPPVTGDLFVAGQVFANWEPSVINIHVYVIPCTPCKHCAG